MGQSKNCVWNFKIGKYTSSLSPLWVTQAFLSLSALKGKGWDWSELCVLPYKLFAQTVHNPSLHFTAVLQAKLFLRLRLRQCKVLRVKLKVSEDSEVVTELYCGEPLLVSQTMCRLTSYYYRYTVQLVKLNKAVLSWILCTVQAGWTCNNMKGNS